MQTQRIAISELNLDPANVRRHPARNLDAIKASLNRFGQQRPVLVNAKGIIIAGNGTVMAAKALGWDHINIVRTDLEGSEATAYAIADNRTAELAEWDDEALAQQLAALQIDDEELAKAAGFSEAEIAELAGATVEVQEDEVPEAPADPITKPGDLWLLGEHRLLCGDSTKAEDVERLMDGKKADAIITDPPYGIGYQKNGASGSHGWKDYGKVEWDNSRPPDSHIRWMATSTEVAVLWGGNYFADVLPPTMGWLVWDKGQRDFSLADCELAWTSRQKAARVFDMSRASALQDGKVHPTQKPVKLMAWTIEQVTDRALILDPYLGSGTTLIAAEQLGRKCYGMEISPAYCDVIVKRWETLTGKKATRHAAQAAKA